MKYNKGKNHRLEETEDTGKCGQMEQKVDPEFQKELKKKLKSL